jgi:hypothetical protein
VSPRSTGVDETGRPIVAELGRAETPQETADRKSAASAKRRGNQTAFNLVIALVASLGIVLFLVLVVARPDPSGDKSVDYAAAAADAQSGVDTELVVPTVPADWWANRAGLETGADGVTSWQIGFITGTEKYIGLLQGIDANPSWMATQVENARPSGEVSIGGISWSVYDNRDDDDPGNLAYALVTVIGDSTIVLKGDASDEEFATLASSVAAELTS